MLSRRNISEWWSSGSTRSLDELKREAREYHLQQAGRATFRSPSDRAQALDLLRKD
jgi:hypothetical protein